MTTKETLQTMWKIVLSSLLSAGILLMIYSFTRRDNADTKLREEIDSKAKTVDVKSWDEAIVQEMKEEDAQIRVEIVKGDNATLILLKSMDSKIDILLTSK